MDIVKIIEFIFILVFGGLSLYFKANSKLIAKASTLISEAEEKFTSKTEKFDWCVDMLYSFLPAPLRVIFKYIPKPMVEQIIQNVFDDMKAFAKTKLDKATDVVGEKIDEIASEFVELPDAEPESELDIQQ